MSLITPVEPYADESLAGFIVRAAARNHFRRPAVALRETGIKTARLGSLCSRDPSLAIPIAVWAGTQNVETISGMFHQQIDRRIGWINWFGEPLRAINRQRDTRRVAPGTLKKLGYPKAVWTLRPFSFDPSSKERLIDACPNCNRVLGWTRTYGVAYCDYCSRPEIFGEFTWPYPDLDLRDFPQEQIQVEDEEALDFITGLIDPSAEVKQRSRKLVPEMWSSLSNGDIFEVGLSFASMFNQDHWDKKRQHIRRKPKAGEGWDCLNPRLLAIGGRALMGGQRGFEELADILRREAEGKPREAKYGKLAEIGSLSVIDLNLCEAARKILGKATEACVAARRDPDMQPLQKLAQKHGIPRDALKLLAETGVVPTVKNEAAKLVRILMSARALDPLIREMRASISRVRAASEIGVNEMYLEELSRCGLLTRVEGPVLKLLMTEACYTRASVETLKQNIWKQVRQNPPSNCLRLRSALRACKARSVPWSALVQAILDGRLEVFAIKCIEKLHSLADRLGVRDAAQLSSLLSGMPSPAAEWIGNSTASQILGVNETVVWMLVRSGAIKKHDDAPRYLHFRGSEVERFASQMIFTPEIVRTGHFKTYRKASAWLQQEGIAPRLELKTGGWKGYSRAEVESGLKRPVVKKPKPPSTRKEWGYGPNSTKGKLAAARELSDKSRIGYVTAAIILGATVRMVRSLVAHGLLLASDDATPFHRAEVEALAKRFVFTPETMRLTGYLDFRGLKNWLTNAGIEPLYQFRASGHVFDRAAVEDLVARTEFVSGQHPHWIKRKLLNIVERGNSVHQASIACGVSYATAKKWASSQRNVK